MFLQQMLNVSALLLDDELLQRMCCYRSRVVFNDCYFKTGKFHKLYCR